MLLDSLRTKLIEYQKSKAEIEVSTLRLLISELKNKEIELKGAGKEVSSEDELKILKKQIKNRNETIPMYEKAGRTETAEKEKKEVDFIQLLMKEYFPNEISN
jgi:uncharacterized protein YqeY